MDLLRTNHSGLRIRIVVGNGFFRFAFPKEQGRNQERRRRVGDGVEILDMMWQETTTIAEYFDVGRHPRHPPSQCYDERGTCQVDTAALNTAVERHFHGNDFPPVQSEEARNVRGAECHKVISQPSLPVGHQGGSPALAREECLVVGDSKDGRLVDPGGLHSANRWRTALKGRRVSMSMSGVCLRCTLLGV